ncbi:MAG: nucleotide sugar dehydrogenase, partial [Flavobacteriaceae bacterium]|nr:nucleotide sugar dehydrogenase [Flavobacteriaceae bacterium]
IKKGVAINGASLLMLGITFKENCPDVRNTKIVDVIHAFEDYGIKVSLYDPWANPAEVLHEYGFIASNEAPSATFDAVVLGVAHNQFLDMDIDALRNQNSVLYDVKGVLDDNVDGKL